MSNTDRDRLSDPAPGADPDRPVDGGAADPKPARIGSAPAPDAAETPDSLPTGEAAREDIGGGSTARSSVEGVDEGAAERDAIRDATS